MLCSFRLLFCLVVRLFRSQRNLLFDNLALRQQLLILKRKTQSQTHFDHLFWVMVRRTWSKLEGSTCDCHSRDCGRLASNRLSALLAMAFLASEGSWKKTF